MTTPRKPADQLLSPRHGMAGHPVYKVWEAMIQRCTNPNCKSYPNYGGRGITVCDEWRRDFMAFYRDMGPRPDGLTLDRTDVNGNYEPANCRWATYSEQNANLRPRTHCKNGHRRTAENVYVNPATGQQTCRECKGRRVPCEACGMEVAFSQRARHRRRCEVVKVLSEGVL